ncbi:long-chain-fatty-acid--CoA ligase [Gayadomonas joobiniege]|uniref:long-chain-fatty-acid--CoA ligase n=1 Tax=Gayadomonas joobiniege TaxID=1234606 RepID=UPI00035C4D82|nr:long-chain-fatty-acid--CoA ligase [Gayadomonas joobiniege]
MQKIWLNEYQSGVPAEVELNTFNNLPEMLKDACEKFSQRTAYICMGQAISYAELDKKSDDFASYLQNTLNLQTGDVVALMMPNCLQYPISILGVLKAGCTVANVNPLYTARELKHQLVDSQAKAIVIVENFANTLEKVVNDTQIKHIVATELGDQLAFPKRLLVNFVVKYIRKMVPDFNLPSQVKFNEVLKKGAQAPLTAPDLNHDNIAFLQYTGGTTGAAKGVMLTHGNILANLAQVKAWLDPCLEYGKEVVITALPLYHIFALLANCFNFIAYGATNVLIVNPRDMKTFLGELRKHEFTALTGVNTLFNGMMNHEKFSDVDFSHLKLSLGGGMAVQKPVAERWQKLTGTRLLEAYGLTECSPAVTINPLNLQHYNGSIGLPIPSTDCRIVDENGEVLGIEEAGELQVKGPQVMKGYYNRPQETQAVLKDGWFSTGDIAVCDERGYFKIVDRKKDMILVSGFNVYPNEIEEVVAMHDKVLEVAAVGIPDEKCGELVKVFIVAKDASLNKEEIINHCRENLTGYKVPKAVEFRDELPKTNVGKILRRELRDS